MLLLLFKLIVFFMESEEFGMDDFEIFKFVLFLMKYGVLLFMFNIMIFILMILKNVLIVDWVFMFNLIL